jgi:hypothetical protein
LMRADIFMFAPLPETLGAPTRLITSRFNASSALAGALGISLGTDVFVSGARSACASRVLASTLCLPRFCRVSVCAKSRACVHVWLHSLRTIMCSCCCLRSSCLLCVCWSCVVRCGVVRLSATVRVRLRCALRRGTHSVPDPVTDVSSAGPTLLYQSTGAPGQVPGLPPVTTDLPLLGRTWRLVVSPSRSLATATALLSLTRAVGLVIPVAVCAITCVVLTALFVARNRRVVANAKSFEAYVRVYTATVGGRSGWLGAVYIAIASLSNPRR